MNEWIIYKKMLLDLPCATEYFYGKKMEEKWKQWQISFSWAPKSLWIVTDAMKLKDVCS